MSEAKMIDNRKKFDFPELLFVINNSLTQKPSLLSYFPGSAIDIIKMKTNEIRRSFFYKSIY